MPNSATPQVLGGAAELRSWGLGDLEPHKPFEFQLCNSPSAGGVLRSCGVAELEPVNLSKGMVLPRIYPETNQ
jgi:hypothetical protein